MIFPIGINLTAELFIYLFIKFKPDVNNILNLGDCRWWDPTFLNLNSPFIQFYFTLLFG